MMPPRSPDFTDVARDGWMFAAGVAVLMYHKVAPAPPETRLPVFYVDPGVFARQMDGLLAAGLTCLPYDELFPAASAPGQCAGGKFVLTFDDGCRNVFDHALPVLSARGLRAIQFLVADCLGGEDAWDRAVGEPPLPLMNDSQVREWLAAGQDIGAHTLTHPRLTQISPAQARAEIFDSKKLLEDRFGRRVDHFCYPYGDHDARTCDLVAEAGYRTACTVEPGVNGPGEVDPWRLRRFTAVNPPSGSVLAAEGTPVERFLRQGEAPPPFRETPP